jgi:hypothetical protein
VGLGAHLSIEQVFSDLIVNGANVLFASIDRERGRRAAELRARYNPSLTDAFQIAVALQSGCDAFLTNDMTLKRVSELSVIVLEEMENVLAAFGVEPNVHGAAVHDLYLIEVKLRMTHQIVFDDLFEVFPINLDLVFYKAFILVIFHRIDIAHGSLHSRTT